MKKLSLLVILLFSCLNVHAQAKEFIVGRWNLVETIKDTTSGFEPLLSITTQDPEDLGKENKKKDEVVFFFTVDGIFQELRFGRQIRTDYKFISDEVLVIGVTTFKISKLTVDTLRIERYEEMMLFPPDILVFQKSDEPFQLIKEFEKHLIYHGNGRVKEKGQRHNGFENGIWKEWHSNGQLKSEKRFSDGIPVGIWKTWNEHGKLIKEENKNLY